MVHMSTAQKKQIQNFPQFVELKINTTDRRSKKKERMETIIANTTRNIAMQQSTFHKYR